MTKKEDITPVELYSGTQGEVDVLITLLENAEIPVYLENNYSGTILPNVSPGGAAPITVVVSSEDEEKAKIVLDHFLKNHKG